ncbi:MAG: FKBP-type peptidyl-prolyl cis-trans isomerase [Phycisphaeraceae bacterium]|nr:FKBP-type peptidyl-prolyl cis-trans isomerase [Phycisphaeraceae bacterium]
MAKRSVWFVGLGVGGLVLMMTVMAKSASDAKPADTQPTATAPKAARERPKPKEQSPFTPIVGEGGFTLTTPAEKVAYMAGFETSRALLRMFPTLKQNKELIVRGIDDLLDNRVPFNEEQLEQIKYDVQKQVALDRSERQRKKQLQLNQEDMEKFAQREGVRVADNGLLYRVIAEGKPLHPSETDSVRIHYTMSLGDGTVVDDTRQAAQPAEVLVSSLPKGMAQALLMMGEGARWEIALRPDLAYGEQGLNKKVPAYAALWIDVELIAIVGASK